MKCWSGAWSLYVAISACEKGEHLERALELLGNMREHGLDMCAGFLGNLMVQGAATSQTLLQAE